MGCGNWGFLHGLGWWLVFIHLFINANEGEARKTVWNGKREMVILRNVRQPDGERKRKRREWRDPKKRKRLITHKTVHGRSNLGRQNEGNGGMMRTGENR